MGEKLFEEVLTAEEGVEPTTHPKNFKANIGKSFSDEFLNGRIEELKGFAQIQDRTAIIRTLQEMIPTYNPDWPNPKE